MYAEINTSNNPDTPLPPLGDLGFLWAVSRLRVQFRIWCHGCCGFRVLQGFFHKNCTYPFLKNALYPPKRQYPSVSAI